MTFGSERPASRHECDMFEADSGHWFVRCYACAWWVRKVDKASAAAAALMHEKQGRLFA